MLDIHCHILPGIDDGPATWEDAVAMARLAMKDGVTGLVATPHYLPGGFDPSPDQICQGVAELESRLALEDVALTLYAGMEVYLTPETSREWQQQKLLGLGKGRYLLLELPAAEVPQYTSQALFQLRVKGVIPVLAHPERNLEILGNPERLLPLIEQGALVQVNSGSLCGLFGQKARDVALQLVKRNMAHCLGSDGHSLARRSPVLAGAYAVLEKVAGPEVVDCWKQTAWNLVLGKDVVVSPPLPASKRSSRHWWFFKRKRGY